MRRWKLPLAALFRKYGNNQEHTGILVACVSGPLGGHDFDAGDDYGFYQTTKALLHELKGEPFYLTSFLFHVAAFLWCTPY